MDMGEYLEGGREETNLVERKSVFRDRKGRRWLKQIRNKKKGREGGGGLLKLIEGMTGFQSGGSGGRVGSLCRSWRKGTQGELSMATRVPGHRMCPSPHPSETRSRKCFRSLCERVEKRGEE
jgi:hypothetical protein